MPVVAPGTWTFDWFLTDLPIARNMAPNFINDANWLWGYDIPEIDGLVTDIQDIRDHREI